MSTPEPVLQRLRDDRWIDGTRPAAWRARTCRRARPPRRRWPISAPSTSTCAWKAHEEGYRLNHRKTRLATQVMQQRVCGVVVNAHPNLPRRDFDRLRAELHHCLHHGPPAGDEGYHARLLGRVQWASQLNPAKAQRLHRLWNGIVWPAQASA